MAPLSAEPSFTLRVRTEIIPGLLSQLGSNLLLCRHQLWHVEHHYNRRPRLHSGPGASARGLCSRGPSSLLAMAASLQGSYSDTTVDCKCPEGEGLNRLIVMNVSSQARSRILLSCNCLGPDCDCLVLSAGHVGSGLQLPTANAFERHPCAVRASSSLPSSSQWIRPRSFTCRGLAQGADHRRRERASARRQPGHGQIRQLRRHHAFLVLRPQRCAS